jgi:glycerol-3-phosphate dehydrogenase (NAD(P)+)
MVVEGARAAKSVWKLCCEKGIEAPITGAVHAILYEGTPVDAAIATLLGRSPRVEFYGL